MREVIEYKREGIPQRANNGNTLSLLFQQGLPLNDSDIDDLVAVVEDALDDKRLSRYVPKKLPSGSCFPVADMQSAIELGCILE